MPSPESNAPQQPKSGRSTRLLGREGSSRSVERLVSRLTSHVSRQTRGTCDVRREACDAPSASLGFLDLCESLLQMSTLDIVDWKRQGGTKALGRLGRAARPG